MRTWFFGDANHQPLETRLFFMFSSFVMLSALGALMVNLAINSAPVELVYSVIAGVIALVLHLIGRRIPQPERLVAPLQLLAVFILSAAWFSNNGVHGSVPYFFFPLLVMSAIATRGVRRVVAIGGIGTAFFGLVLLEWRKPSLIQSYATDTAWFNDVVAVLAVTFGVCVALAVTLVKAYADERERVVQLTAEATRNRLEATRLAEELEAIREILPICAGCKKIKDEKGDWHEIEQYLSAATGTKYSHGLCENCFESFYGDEANG